MATRRATSAPRDSVSPVVAAQPAASSSSGAALDSTTRVLRRASASAASLRILVTAASASDRAASHSLARTEPLRVAREFAAFADWAAASLDSVRAGLSRLGFALLLACYAELLLEDDTGAGGEAGGDWEGRDEGRADGEEGESEEEEAGGSRSCKRGGARKAAALSRRGTRQATDAAPPRSGPRPFDVARAMLLAHRERFASLPGSASAVAALLLVTSPLQQLFRDAAGSGRAARISALRTRCFVPPSTSSSASASAPALSAAPAALAVYGDVLLRLVDPAQRLRVVLPPLALQLALECLMRTGAAFLLGRLNERVSIGLAAAPLSLASAGADTDAAVAAAQLGEPQPAGPLALPVEDVVAGLARTVDLAAAAATAAAAAAALPACATAASAAAAVSASASSSAASAAVPASAAAAEAAAQAAAAARAVPWGAPFAPASCFMGAVERRAVPWPDYRGHPLGRALLSAAMPPPASQPPPPPSSLLAGPRSLPALRTCVVADAGEALLCCATALGGPAGASLDDSPLAYTRAVAAGFCDGSVRAWLTVEWGWERWRLPGQGKGPGPAPRFSTTLCLQTSAASAASAAPVLSLAVSACREYLLSGHGDGSLRLWHLALFAARGLRGLAAEMAAAGIRASFGVAAGAGAGSGASSAPAHASVAAAPPSSSAVVEMSAPLLELHGHSGLPVWACTFCPLAASVIASGGRDGCAYLWSSGGAADTPQRAFAGHAGDVCALAFHPNGLLLATASADGSCRLWDTAAGAPLALYAAAGGGGARFGCLAFAPSGRFLAAGDDAGRVSLWELGSGLSIAAWAGLGVGGARAAVEALAFSADGRRLASASSADDGGGGSGGAGRACIWDVVAAVQRFDGSRRGGRNGGAAAVAAAVPAAAAAAKTGGVEGLEGMLLLPGLTTHALEWAGAEEVVVCGGTA